MHHRSRALVGGALLALALAPATAAAGPPAKLLEAGAPPRLAVAGQAFTLKGKVQNRARRAARARLTVSVRRTKASKDGRVVGVRHLKRMRAGRSLRYRVRVRLPASLAAGRYHVVTCARAGNRRASCAFAKRRLTVRAATRSGAERPAAQGAPPAAQESPPPGTPAPPRPADPPPGPVVEDGRTQPVYGYADAIRQRVWVPIEFDTDGDGTNDRISVDIIRPRATAEGLDVPVIMDASPYYDTVCRGNEGECKSDVDGDGLNDRWPLFYDNYFVPRGYAVALLDTVGTNNSTGCPTVGGREDILGITRVIDWLNGRATGFDEQWGGERVEADWSTGNVGMWGKSYDGTHANGAAATGVEGLRTIVPISAISSWYKYYRINGLRFSAGGPSGLARTVTTPSRRDECEPSRQRISTAAGEQTVAPETQGNLNPFWDERDYEKDAANVNASVFLIHGLNDYNVKPNNYDEWWDNLAANDVPRKIWLTQLGHVDPFDFDRMEWVDTIHGWFDFWLQDVDNGIMDEPMARIEQQPNLTGTTPAFREYASFPDPGAERTQVWLRSPDEDDEPGSLSTARQQAEATATWTDDRDQYVDDYRRADKAIDDPDDVTNPSRLAYLSPELPRGVRVSGRSSVTVRISADQADAALGAVLVDYADDPFQAIAYRSSDGAFTLEDEPEDCFGESSFFDDGCYFRMGRRYRETTQEVVGRGAIDMQNRDSLREKRPLAPGEDVWVQVPLWTNDYTFLAGHRIGVVLVGTFRDYGTQAKTGPVPTYEIEVQDSRLTLPVVGGRAALGF
jgi:X-Pro dipeptidyl-peptidase